MYKNVFDLYGPLDEIEKIQRATHQLVTDFDPLPAKMQQLQLKEQTFLNEHNIIIRQHRRFAHYPVHSHQFLEFNYLLQGQSKQIINGNHVTLNERQLLLLDTNSSHELFPLGEKDLLINFLFKTSTFGLDFLRNLDQSNYGLTTNFIMNAILKNDTTENFLLLDLNHSLEIQNTLEQIILEFHSKKSHSESIINAYLEVLFLQLSRIYHHQLTQFYQKKDVIVQVLSEIETNYATLTLESLSNKLTYNKNYLSNLIKKRTGKTFKTLVTNQKLHEAHKLILSTDIPIEAISVHVGYSNKTQFYAKYKSYFGETPLTSRNHR